MANKKKKATRRGNNEGTVFQRPDGYWIATVSLGYDQNGKRIRKTFSGKTKAEVTLKMTELTVEKMKGGNTLTINNEPLRVLMYQWLINHKRAEVTPRTFERCIANARLHIFPKIGDLTVDQVDMDVIQRLLNNLLFKGYSLASVRKIKFLLNQFFDYAKKRGWAQENPVDECRVKNTSEHKEQTREVYKAIPAEVREKFLDALETNPTLKPICLVQMLAGLRIGETLALTWKDLDFDNNIIHIDNAITVEPILDKDGKKIASRTIISDTKTAASVRDVPMIPTLEEALLEWKKLRWILQREKGISFLEPDDLVFSTNKGELRSYYGTKCLFDRLMKEHGLEKYHFHFHTLRHTFSNILWEAHENPKVIQMLLGHADVSTTIKSYNSVDRAYFKQAMSIVEKSVKKKD